MARSCRFCRQPAVVPLFPANKPGRKARQVADYACTNAAFGRHGPLVKCRHCRLIYTDESVSQEKISTYYEVADDPLYFAEQPARQLTFCRYLEKLEKSFPERSKLLDVGTNTGLFVKLARERGWEASGLEPNRWAVAFAKKNYGVALINKPFEKGVFAPESFNVITMWDVIEHFTNPPAEIKKVFWYLKPGGLFAFSTVDPESFLAKLMGTGWSWFMEMHRVFFCQQAARFYLEKAGFKKIIFTPHWRNLSLGYLSTRLAAVHPVLSLLAGKIVSLVGLSSTIVPYYANDLYDCYAFK
jgi:2-polyprenyl-3-methyl-5-hydroxy-6-metoxy-1,4-benzoquinol methylase